MDPIGSLDAPQQPSEVTIHFLLADGTEFLFREGFVDDDQVRLRTFTILPFRLAQALTQRWWDEGLVPRARRLHAVHKCWFYHEPFNILRYVDTQGALIGTYTDLLAGFERLRRGHYRATDRILDVWVYPDGRAVELDWDEFEVAVAAGLLDDSQATKVRLTIKRLRAEIAVGAFPADYCTS